LIHPPGNVLEIRVLKAGRWKTVSGYFNDLESLVRAVAPYAGKPEVSGIYFTLNQCDRALFARAANILKPYAEVTTSDADIVRRLALGIDFDPKRPSKISSTQAEHTAAIRQARQCREWLSAMGWPDPIVADSGNGGHLVYGLDLPNDEETKQMIEKVRAAIDLYHSTPEILIDTGVFNASRIWKLYGTMARKGSDIPERPHRLSAVIEAPDILTPVPLDRVLSPAGRPLDPAQWLPTHGLEVRRTKPWRGGVLYELAVCPWNAEHHEGEARVLQFANGALQAACFHNGCRGKGWHDLRDLVEPGWRQRRHPTKQHSQLQSERDAAEQVEADRSEVGSPWTHAKPAPTLLAEAEGVQAWIIRDILAPGSVTAFMAPRGLGKTHVGHRIAVAVATGGIFRGEAVIQGRVLLVDRDNSPREIKRRLRGWGGNEAPELRVLCRDEAPELKDAKAWGAFPFADYALVIIDSIGAATEGIAEKDSAEAGKAMAHLLDLARKGPAVLVLGNTIKSAEHYRGSGSWADRLDILYEIRDATDLKPSGTRAWWEELPPAGEAAWAERAKRRKQRSTYRLALIPSKFRVGAEPEPFCLELALDEPWAIRDVTAELLQEGEAAKLETAHAHQVRLERAVGVLAAKVLERHTAGDPIPKTEAEEYLHKVLGLRRKEARDLLPQEDDKH
jgi:hypothetical protein